MQPLRGPFDTSATQPTQGERISGRRQELLQLQPQPSLSAAMVGNALAVQALLKAGANADRPMPNGATALMAAVLSGNTATVQALLQAGANFRIKSKTGNTALSLAIESQHEEIIELLRAHGAAA